MPPQNTDEHYPMDYDYGENQTQTYDDFSTMLVYSITPAAAIVLLIVFVLLIIIPIKLRSEHCKDFPNVILYIKLIIRL